MTDYIEVRFDISPCSEVMTDVLAAILSEKGFESFIPDDSGLTAYIPQDKFNGDLIEISDDEWIFESEIKSSWQKIPGRDWNIEWERNYFKPIVIDDRCVIHSSFHTGYPDCPYDIIIDPKMAFGTGHHATTSLIVGQLLDMTLSDKKVIDMGTGTGILAILAYKLGATPVIAVEIDPVAYENTLENIALNNCNGIDVRLGDVKAIRDEKNADILLANINRNVIMADLNDYVHSLASGGRIILSGFLYSDITICQEEMKKAGLKEISVLTKGDWASLTAVLL